MCRSIGCHRARQNQARCPDSLRHQRCCGNTKAIYRCDFLEKQSVARHRIIHTRSGENQSIVATECGNHNRRGHTHRARLAEERIHHRHSNAILRGVLNLRKRQDRQISSVRQQIKYDHDAAASDKCAHQILSRIANFAADKCDICPGGLGEKGANH